MQNATEQSMTDGLLPLESLFGKKFNVPSYQRGFRWQAESEVQVLLDDLLEFFSSESIKKNDCFYCLQPLVIKRNNGQLNVLDGQQRLTTFFLIFKVLFPEQESFEITYETRKGSSSFLKGIQNSSDDQVSENIDFFHMHAAYYKILNWMDEDKRELFVKFLKTKAKIIWYEVNKEEDEKNVFLRLNIGKIPLTNAELIKALFLSKSETEDDDYIRDRATLWYECELNTRKDNDKVYCLYNNINHQDDLYENSETKEMALSDNITRIEMYFDLLSGIQKTNKTDKYATFNYYSNRLKTEEREYLWEEFKTCQERLISFADPQTRDERRLYHYIGFSIFINMLDKKNIMEISSKLCNSDFLSDLKARICKNTKKYGDIEDLNYGVNSKELNYFLLLFNLEDLNIRAGLRRIFEFNRFKLQKWSLEHINPQKLKNTTDLDIKKSWLKDIADHITDEKLKKEVKKFNVTIDDDKKFEEIVKQIGNATELHSISNLVLLDNKSNSTLSNNTFLVKRELIDELAKDERLIPHCTGEVFKKVYTDLDKRGNPNTWTKEDSTFYLEKIRTTLKDFLSEDIYNG